MLTALSSATMSCYLR